jgi:cytidine deaminase
MNKQWIKLVQAAKRVRENAYAPHSKFKVGAAVLAKSGKIYTGCNVENASFSIGICAERSAISNAIANGESDIVAVAVIADSQPITPPCGACRQFIQEFGPKATIILTNVKGDIAVYTQNQLLPYPFTNKMLKKKK